MYFLRDLRVQLRGRRNRLYKARHETYQSELKFFLAFVESTPYLRALVQELNALHPELEWQAWRDAHFSRGFSVVLPDQDEAALAKVCYGFIRECVEQGNTRNYAVAVSHKRTFDEMYRYLTELLVDPFVNYLEDRINEGNNTLYVLEKYKRRTEWFHREELMALIQDDPSRSERTVDSHLREYLFDQGIEYPFSTPASPSGEADIVADMGETRPLVLEIKLFDPERGYDRRYVRQGFRQIFDYTTDYGQSVGYLVVFNCSPKPLVFETSTKRREWPPRVEIDSRTFFLIVVDLATHERSASKRGPLEPYVINETYLTSPALGMDQEPNDVPNAITDQGRVTATTPFSGHQFSVATALMR